MLVGDCSDHFIARSNIIGKPCLKNPVVVAHRLMIFTSRCTQAWRAVLSSDTIELSRGLGPLVCHARSRGGRWRSSTPRLLRLSLASGYLARAITAHSEFTVTHAMEKQHLTATESRMRGQCSAATGSASDSGS